MKNKTFIFFGLLGAVLTFGQQNYWKKTDGEKEKELAPRNVMPKTFSLYNLDLDKIKEELKKAPERFSDDHSLVLKFPDADGEFHDYIVQEASIMEPELQERFSDIRSYTGWEENHPENTIRFSTSPETGISIMYFNGWNISYLDAYTKDNTSFIYYKREDLPANPTPFRCSIQEDADQLLGNDQLSDNFVSGRPMVSDGVFRTYKLALAATGEYTKYHGGTIHGAMAAMATTMTRVNGVYEKTIAVTMVMVANNHLLIYRNPATDPYTNGDEDKMLNENVKNINNVIGFAHYNIGHVFGVNSGGVAGLRVICSKLKAQGVTGSGTPINDPFDIDYVAHEMGHQFGANHTFRANTVACKGNVNNRTAYEPGSASTIMGYAGICGGNSIQPHSDAYFHAASVKEMYYTISRDIDCSAKRRMVNRVPTANAGLDYSIPKGTAFVLTGQGTDPDNDPLTYLWEQYDNKNNIQPPLPSNVQGPVYRSRLPKTENMRYFPHLSAVLSNNLTPMWEVTPNVARTLNFSLLVNDNRATGNQTAHDAMVVTVTNAGPFKVTSHTGNSYSPGTHTIKWNVAGTDTGAVNTKYVTILLSKDGGYHFDTVLAANVPNNGSAVVNFPNENIGTARIMVKAVGNIYFAVNTTNFSIAKTASQVKKEIKTNRFAVYPNPSHDEVNIRLDDENSEALYSLMDSSGRIVKKGNLKGYAKILVHDFAAGTYFVTVNTTNGKKYTEKLIINK
ncbi:T9SS C-terminal target domain-containing protein [Chryseobacterium cucumeris]|uniref:T9SS C-terminal target domain-containing protein n=3 Tax=Chryseobacterium cucumeris TaxID=1813611 RepID=A0ABX9X6S3_9FLAO|nr:zinc-dependent metalloprotease family protein [Chryseobacterium cucumeris]ROH90070.1 T9SS C-terminal target domain-containing protein [Chryseobacterium cucumeris]